MRELIALCGIDGTGKSTQASLLREQLSASGVPTEVLWCRWDPVLARPAIWLLGRLSRRDRAESARPSANDESVETRRALKGRLLSNPLIRRLWTGVMVLDYGLQVAPKLSRARRKADVVIVDRYRHDVLVDLSAGGEFVSTPRILRWLLPEPDLIIVLDVDEEVAFARKPDSPDITYLTQRRQLYRQLAQAPNAILLEASESTEAVSDSVFREIVNHSNLHGGTGK
jgi:thymidylate kinase